MRSGYVKAVRCDKGFGFIRCDDSSVGDVFFHATEVDGSVEFDERLIEQRVVFQLVATVRGLKAVAVRPADD